MTLRLDAVQGLWRIGHHLGEDNQGYAANARMTLVLRFCSRQPSDPQEIIVLLRSKVSRASGRFSQCVLVLARTGCGALSKVFGSGVPGRLSCKAPKPLAERSSLLLQPEPKA